MIGNPSPALREEGASKDGRLRRAIAPDEGLAAFRLAARALTPTLSRKSGKGGFSLLRRRFDVVLVVDREWPHQDAQALGAGGILRNRIFAHAPGLYFPNLFRLPRNGDDL